MKKMSLFMGMIAFISITTSCEQDLQSDTTVNAKSGFDAEAFYNQLLENPENGLDYYDELSESEATALMVFKYQEFKQNNSLTASQINAVDAAIAFVEDFTITSGEVPENAIQSVTSLIYEQFDVFNAHLLIYHFENSPTQVQGRPFWGDRYTLNQGCHEEFVDGESIGFYETITVSRYRFGVRTRLWENTLQPCGNFAFLTGA